MIVSCAVAIALDTHMGGWRVIRTLGKGSVDIKSPQAVAAERRVTSVRLPLDRMRHVKRAFDVELNDVVFAIMSGALRDYLQDREGIPDRPLVAQVPLSTRVKRKGGGSEFGNQVTTVAVSLATDISDPVERMNASFRNSQGSKEMTKALSAHQTMGLTETTPPGLMALGVSSLCRQPFEQPNRPTQCSDLQRAGPGPPLLSRRRARRAGDSPLDGARWRGIEHHLL